MKFYLKPEAEITKFENTDVILTSGEASTPGLKPQGTYESGAGMKLYGDADLMN